VLDGGRRRWVLPKRLQLSRLEQTLTLACSDFHRCRWPTAARLSVLFVPGNHEYGGWTLTRPRPAAGNLRQLGLICSWTAVRGAGRRCGCGAARCGLTLMR
jgi:hypothetical protein